MKPRSGFLCSADARLKWALVALAGTGIPVMAAHGADDPYAAHIAQTEPLSPEEERAKLHVPPGFEIQLVAAEPDIGKPLNMAFDHRGRLWVTDTYDYPFPELDESKARDGVKILEDTDGDGRADTITRFAGGLTIPVGLLPTHDGAIVFSIPKLYRLTDDDGDDRADSKEELYGTFEYRDTHGLVNSLRWGYDGWVYLTHGFSNTSTVTAKDESSVTMNSGNTFRIRPDGSRVEQFTWGQVNPFGLCFDRRGHLFSADCHTKPVYMLLRGAYYPSFGKPHDGLGFAPQMCRHDHGSTAICGITYYEADHFPAEYRDTVFIGNVLTNRVNFDRVAWQGATPQAVEQPDFIRSDDPWFRPVDIRLGPDGALYIADFYNRIIGHYEVPLTHPGRDRHRGRIWRVVYTGEGGTDRPAAPRSDWSKASVGELINDIGHPNLEVRTQAANQLVHRVGEQAVEPVRSTVATSDNAYRRLHGLWVLERLGALEAETLQAAAGDTDAAVRVHAQRILAERATWATWERDLARAGLADDDPMVCRAAVEALSMHPSPSQLRPLLDVWASTPAQDTHLVHTVRMAVRDQLRLPATWARLAATPLPPEHTRRIADIAPGLATAESATFLFQYLRTARGALEPAAEPIRHIARYLPESEVDSLVAVLRERTAPRNQRVQLLDALYRGWQQRGAEPTANMREWADEEISAALDDANADTVFRAVELVRNLRLSAHTERVATIATSTDLSTRARQMACDALIVVDPDHALDLLGGILTRPDEPVDLREQVARLLGDLRREASADRLVTALRVAPERLARRIAESLANSPDGAERLLSEIEAGRASALLLSDRGLRIRLERAEIPDLDVRIAEATKGLPEPDERIAQLMRRRRAGFVKAATDLTHGAQVFEKICAACHQIGDRGNKIGPELHGIGLRGLDRILEDTLDPNRNVDQAFRATLVLLEGDVVRSGLLQDDTSEVLVLADAAGNLVNYPKDEIVEWRVTNASPMPSNIAEDLPEQDFYDLLAYLLAQRQSDEPTDSP